MFNFEQSIADWRRRMLAAGIKSPEPLEELESHLRDEFEQRVKSGLNEPAAFELAAQQVGQAAALQEEFEKVGPTIGERWRKLKGLLFGSSEVPLPSLEHFAPSARHTLEIAPAEARRFHHDFIGTEHLLLSLINAQPAVTAGFLSRLGVNSDAIRREIEKIVGRGVPHVAVEKIPFTPRARRALQLAVSEARILNQSAAGAEHLFLGLLLEGSGVAALVLKSMGVQIEKTRREI